MNHTTLPDSGPLGLITNPTASLQTAACGGVTHQVNLAADDYIRLPKIPCPSPEQVAAAVDGRIGHCTTKAERYQRLLGCAASAILSNRLLHPRTQNAKINLPSVHTSGS